MDLFMSTYENKLDRKGRVSVPAPFRLVLDKRRQPLIVTRSLTHACLEGMGAERMEQILDAMDGMDSLSEEVGILQTLLASAQELKPDSEGRVVLPEEYIHHAGLSEKVLFVGIGRSFQLWNSEDYQNRDKAMREKARSEGLPKLVLGRPGGTRHVPGTGADRGGHEQ